MTAQKTPVMFVHGMWLHSSSWQPWVEAFSAAGYDPVTPEWPGVPDTIAESRANPSSQDGGIGLAEIIEHLAQFTATLPSKPILIGHSVGGFLVEKLLGDDVGTACIAISPAQMQGVKAVGIGQAKSLFHILIHSSNKEKAVSLDKDQFASSFGNTLSRKESDELHEKWAIPSPALPLFQLATSALHSDSPAKINTENDRRGPLLLMSGKKDHTVDQVLVHSAFKQYKNSSAVTEQLDYDDRGHSLIVDSGSPQLIADSLTWLENKGLR